MEAEEKLRQSERRYRRLHDSMMDAFVCVDMSGRIVEFNRAYQQMLGYTPDELRKLRDVETTAERWHDVEAQIVQDQVLPHGFSEVYEKEE